MDKQQMFDIAYKKVKEQGALCLEGASCFYKRVVDGKELRCAVGWLLDADAFEKRGIKLENLAGSVDGLITNRKLSLGLGEEDPSVKLFLAQLQIAHDDAAFDASGFDNVRRDPAGDLERFEANMRAVANTYGLTFPE